MSWSLSNEPETDAKKEPGALTGCWGGIAPAVHAPNQNTELALGKAGLDACPFGNVSFEIVSLELFYFGWDVVATLSFVSGARGKTL